MKSTFISAGRLTFFALLSSQFHITNAVILMGTAKTYGAIAGQAVSNTANTLITGDCGTCPGTSITGFPPGVVTGLITPNTLQACTAEKYCQAAYQNAWASVPTTLLPGPNLGGLVLPPGVYTFPTPAAVLTTVLTLNGASNPKGQWIFLIKTTLTTSPSSAVVLVNGAQPCNVFFAVGTAALLGDATKFNGNLLAYDTIRSSKGVSNNGTFCAIKGPITMIYNSLTALPGTCYN